ncbi:MAG: TonB-dependent receptor [Silvibacterium sp.]|nr:TonB-dependent receptor [Silvibacterium sp.]
MVDSDPCAGNATSQAQANTPGSLSNLCRQTGVPVAQLGLLEQPTTGYVNFTQRGNPALSPETANTQTIGAIFGGGASDAYSLTIDYFHIKLTNTIGDPGFDDIFQGCYSPALNPSYAFNNACSFIRRSQLTGMLEGNGVPGVILQTSNQGVFRTSGIDLGGNLRLHAEDLGLASRWGSLSFAALATLVQSLDFQSTPTAPSRKCLGYYSYDCGNAFGGVNPRLKFRLRSAWDLDDLTLALLWRHIGGTKVEPGSGTYLPQFSTIGSYDYLDCDLVWRPSQQWRVSLSVQNLLKRQPPIVGAGVGYGSQDSGNTFPQDYDVIGRYFTLGFRWNY